MLLMMIVLPFFIQLSCSKKREHSNNGMHSITKDIRRSVKSAKKKGHKLEMQPKFRTLIETRKCRCEPCSTGLGPLQEVQIRLLKGQLHNQQGYILKCRKRILDLLQYMKKHKIVT